MIWFGGGSVDRTFRFGGSAEPHRTSKFGRTEPEPEWFGRSLLKMTRIALKHLYGTGGTGISSDKTGIFKLNLEKVKKEFSK